MKISEILENNQQLNEINLRKAAIAGIAASSLFTPMKSKDEPTPIGNKSTSELIHHTIKPIHHQARHHYKVTVKSIIKKYKTNPKVAKQIIRFAKKYSYPTFPKTHDIIALIGIESSFNPDAISNLTTDPAVGLMQIRPGVWNISPKDFNNIENQIKHGSKILHTYYTQLKDKDAAIQAYNIGITNYLRGNKSSRGLAYLIKFQKELNLYQI